MKTKKYWLSIFLVLALTACSSVTTLTKSNMNKIQLGMSKKQVTSILGNGYTIAEKRVEKEAQIEVLSYQDFWKENEFYMFVFADNKLEKWYRELLPKYKKD